MVEMERDFEEELLGGVDSLVPRSNGIHRPTFAPTKSNSHTPPHTDFAHGKEEDEDEDEDDEENSVEDEIPDFLGEQTPRGSETETPNGSSGMDFQGDDQSTPKSSLDTDLEYAEIRKHQSTAIFSIRKDAENGTPKSDAAAAAAAEEEEGQQDLQVDIEKVINDQETHDLFCPNCNSCITRRVILRRRKRKIQDISETLITPEEPLIPEEEEEEDSPPQQQIVPEGVAVGDADADADTEPAAFRCLSCFSIFIPIGRSFKLFPFPFGGRPLKETPRGTPPVTASDPPANTTLIRPGAVDVQEDLGVVTAREQSPSNNSRPELFPEQARTPTFNTAAFVDADSKHPLTEVDDIMPFPAEQSLTPEAEAEVEADGGSQLQLTKGDRLAVPAEQTLPPEGEVDGGNKIQLTKGDSLAFPAEQTLPPEGEVDGGNKLLDAKSISSTEIAEENKVSVDAREEMQIIIDRAEPQAAVPSTLLYPQKQATGIEPVDPGNPVTVRVFQGSDETVVSVSVPTDSSPETQPLLTPVADTSPIPSTATAVAETGTDDEDPQIDIIKCIIYGGLLESIASLSVVTSAAGADAKTRNIVALGAANMFGGLFIIAHNLRVLKHETSDERYEEVLGRRGHFTLHSVVAVLSYLVFGLLPPLMYGFTFRESNNRDYKLIAVAAASLLCIIILSLGKSYIRTPPKAYMKTVMYYVGLWTMVCGVSYVAGELLELLLQKLGLFESSSSVAMTVGEFRPVKMPWASS